MGDEEAPIPWEAYWAQIWQTNPINPDEYESWPADRVMRMRWYLANWPKVEPMQ